MLTFFCIHSLLLWIFWIITRKVWLFDFDHLSSHPIAWGQFSALVLKPPNDLRRRVVSWRCWNNMETLPSHSTDWQHLTASRTYIYECTPSCLAWFGWSYVFKFLLVFCLAVLAVSFSCLQCSAERSSTVSPPHFMPWGKKRTSQPQEVPWHRL